MPQVYKKKLGGRTYGNYTEEKLNEALVKVADGESLNKVSKDYGIPYETLHNKFNGKHGHHTGGQTALTNVEEVAIIEELTKCGDWGFPLSLYDLKVFVKNHLDQQGRSVVKFSNNLLGVDWAYCLLKRHKDYIGQLLSSNIAKKRADVSEEYLKEYFNNLKGTNEGVPATHIFNYNETNVSDDLGKKKFIYRRGNDNGLWVCIWPASTTICHI